MAVTSSGVSLLLTLLSALISRIASAYDVSASRSLEHPLRKAGVMAMWFRGGNLITADARREGEKMLSTLTHLAGAGSCIVACMDELDLGSQREYPYRVVTSGLTDDEIDDFSDRLHAEATKSFKVFCRDPSPMFLAKSVEFCVK